eukprot:Tamp_16225.p1 GENE.Tamp_16225~~Tamp_16225.p1  ORF type:complete len:470 (+),score=54.31 Tamp_16225:106-1410(+)
MERVHALLGGSGREQSSVLLFTSSSPQCRQCHAAGLAFAQVAEDYSTSPAVFVELDEQVAATREVFVAAGVTIGPSVLCVPPAGNSTNVGGSRERTWFHESYEQVKSGVDYIRLREYVWECTQTLDEHPTAWLQPLDGEYASNPRRWLKRVAQMAQRLRGYPPPRQAQLPKSIGAAMSAYISAVHSRSIAVADNRSSLPFRPSPDHGRGDALGGFLSQLAQQTDVGLVLESGTGLGGSSRMIAEGLRAGGGSRAGKWLLTVEAVREMWAFASMHLAESGLPVTCLLGTAVGPEALLRPEEVHALWNIMRQAHDRSPFLSPSGADDHFQKLQAHYEMHYEQAKRMVELGPPLLALLCSDEGLHFDVVLLDGGQYSGFAELLVVLDLCRPKYVVLDDTAVEKHWKSVAHMQRLVAEGKWEHIASFPSTSSEAYRSR